MGGEVPPFYIPEVSDSEATWDRYAEAVGLEGDQAEALYELSYHHDGDRYEVRVGEPRHWFPRETGPRGGYRRNAGHRGWSTDTGTVITAIMKTPTVIYVWSLPPYKGWANPSMVGIDEVRAEVHFNAVPPEQGR